MPDQMSDRTPDELSECLPAYMPRRESLEEGKLVSFFQFHRPIIITTIPRHGTSNVQTQYQTRVFERLLNCVLV